MLQTRCPLGRPPAAALSCSRRPRPRQLSAPRLRVHAQAANTQAQAVQQAPPPTSATSQAAADYNRNMAQAMQWEKSPFTYFPERGLYWHAITPTILVGSQPQRASDIDKLKTEVGVSTILNLQEDKDLKYWGVDLAELQHRAAQLDVQLVRTPARDFDPHSLRAMLPAAVAVLERAKQSGGKVYVHCTAGLGRSPAVAIASLYWFGDFQLDEAYKYLTSIRPCGPKRDAIRGATFDLLDHRDWKEFEHLPGHAWATLSDDQKRTIREKIMRIGSHGHH